MLRLVRIASMANVSRCTLNVIAVHSMDGIPEHCQSATNGRKRRNDEMGKEAHVGVGRLISLGDLGNWPRKGVIPMNPYPNGTPVTCFGRGADA